MATSKTMKRTTTPVDGESAEVVSVKQHEQSDLIPCRSLVNGGLYINGNRSSILYTWADYDDVVEVEYRDLIYMIRSNDKSVYEPRIIIEDDEIVAEYPKLGELYDSLYNVDDFREIIKLPDRQMIEVINGLPVGAKESLKGLISTMIHNHSLDSVSKIKTLDGIFGTQMLLTLAQE